MSSVCVCVQRDGVNDLWVGCCAENRLSPHPHPLTNNPSTRLERKPLNVYKYHLQVARQQGQITVINRKSDQTTFALQAFKDGVL